jgi:WbqC-like protein family
MRIAIMQPYFMPYIGYFQLMNAADEFVIYDNIEFTKKGWINRNRILVNGQDSYITLPLKKDSDYLDVCQRYLADIWPEERRKMLNRVAESYRKAPFFKMAYPVLEKCFLFKDNNLFIFIFNSIRVINEYLGITVPLVVASTIPIDHKLKATEKVIEICKSRNADIYINPIGGVDLYSREDFKSEGIDLYFLKTDDISYEQFNNDFVPWLSIIDVIMFNSKERITEILALKRLL